MQSLRLVVIMVLGVLGVLGAVGGCDSESSGGGGEPTPCGEFLECGGEQLCVIGEQAGLPATYHCADRDGCGSCDCLPSCDELGAAGVLTCTDATDGTLTASCGTM